MLATDAAVRCAADAIQVLGGIGYTYEHDAHLYYRKGAVPAGAERRPRRVGRTDGRAGRRRDPAPGEAAGADPVTHRESSRALLGCTRFGSPGIFG
ncbi:acyl-CoA dehydrogenase family protein [Streptosporangium canum]